MVTTSPIVDTDRPASVTAATVALVLGAIVDIANLGGYLSGAPIPPVIVGIWVVLGVATLVAAGGLRGRQRWAAPLALILAVLTVLLGVMGLLTAGSATGKVVAVVGATLGLVVLALVVPYVARRTAA